MNRRNSITKSEGDPTAAVQDYLRRLKELAVKYGG